MNKNLTSKLILITVLVAVAVWTLFPPGEKLKPGIDLAGGTSLIYEIDTHNLKESEKKGLSAKMITVLRRRIDPANIQNLIWRPLGNTRFEIQMPLASAEARQKRNEYGQAEAALLDRNLSPAKILRSLEKPVQERSDLFKLFAQEDPNRVEILDNLATIYDEYTTLKNSRDALYSNLQTAEASMPSAGLDLDRINRNKNGWAKLDPNELQTELQGFPDVNDNLEMLTGYVKTYAEWSEVADQFLAKQILYKDARGTIDRLNLSRDQLDVCLEAPKKERESKIAKLKADFPDRIPEIDEALTAYAAYKPYKGRLDDPMQLRRMLKGAGILEFRILPTKDHSKVDPDLMASYESRLVEKGPDYASDTKYVWREIENIEQWQAAGIVAPFGGKFYVLASNQDGEIMLNTPGQKSWKLERANASTDGEGRRAIAFQLDTRGGMLFGKLTGKNIERPLCILLDSIAISAPNITTRITSQGIISGTFTQTGVDDMVNKLNAGSLPAMLIDQPISVNMIGPSIGVENRDQGIKAGLIGLAAVMVCMLVYYMLAGSVADIALLMNILFILAVMAGVRATFTLPGIAGIILTIGMSVDANVLIFERIREEQQKGSSLRIAVTNGYQKAFRTIFDANLTTFITAAILYWRASEEIRGFAIVLMLGIASSMFTALFVTRTIFDLLLTKRVVKDHLVMLRIIQKPNIDWMRSRPIFFAISSVLVTAGLLVFLTRDNTVNNKYDTEFTGGTTAQISLTEPMSREDVLKKIRKIGEDSANPALANASVYSIGDTGRQYEISTTETNRLIVDVASPQSGAKSIAELTGAIRKAQGQFAGTLTNLLVTQDAGKVIVSTSQMNQSLVKDVLAAAFPDANLADVEPRVDEVVTDAILTAFEGNLEIQQDLVPTIVSEQKIAEDMIASYPELIDFTGGIKIECKIEKAATAGEIAQRFGDLLFKPDMEHLVRYPYRILGTNLSELTDPNQSVTSFVYVSATAEAGLRELDDDEWERFADNEKEKVMAATQLSSSLPRVRQFDPSVGAEQKTRALIAIVLSLFAIVTYIWIRFGDVRYGIAAITALVHDVCITLGAVAACTYIAGTSIGDFLLIGDFKINLAMIAAFLTLIGYSLNDTIVVFDRIRENRGKSGVLTAQVITNSINQTISRTIMTSVTTFIVVLIMYIFGGPGLRGFTFAIGLGIIVGTYSSIAIAAPILLIGTKNAKGKNKKR